MMAARKAEMTVRLRAVGPTVFQIDENASSPENFGAYETSGDWVVESGFVVPPRATIRGCEILWLKR
jgi:hypothetical protein